MEISEMFLDKRCCDITPTSLEMEIGRVTTSPKADLLQIDRLERYAKSFA